MIIKRMQSKNLKENGIEIGQKNRFGMRLLFKVIGNWEGAKWEHVLMVKPASLWKK